MRPRTLRARLTVVLVALAAAIPRRRTDRRTYSPWPVPERDIALMGARAARAGVLLRRLDSLDHLIRIVADAARQHRTDAEYLTELTIWSGRYASTAGVPARNAPMPDGSAPIPPRTFAGAALPQPDVDAAQDGATVIALPMKIKGGTGGPTRIIAIVP